MRGRVRPAMGWPGTCRRWGGSAPILVYALAGTSRPLSVSTTSTLSALTAAAVATASSGDPARALVAASTLLLAGFDAVAAFADPRTSPPPSA